MRSIANKENDIIKTNKVKQKGKRNITKRIHRLPKITSGHEGPEKIKLKKTIQPRTNRLLLKNLTTNVIIVNLKNVYV